MLFDGFPARPTRRPTRRSLEASGRRVDAVVLFEAPNETLVKRLSGRRSCPECGAVYNVYFGPPSLEGVCDRCGGTLVHRADDRAETVERRLQVYLEQTAPLIGFYDAHSAAMTRIGADRDVEAVYADFRAAVGGGTS